MAQYDNDILIKIGRFRLIRHNRVDLHPPFPCLSWRENRISSGTNRRFYFEKEAYWDIPISTALKMMKQAKAKGFLDRTESSVGEITEISVARPVDPYYTELMKSVLVNSPCDAVWHNCVAVICLQADRKWRKVMMLSPSTGSATFRSLSIDPKYGLYRKEKTGDGWRLDDSMLDAHPTAFSYFLNYFESYQPT